MCTTGFGALLTTVEYHTVSTVFLVRPIKKVCWPAVLAGA